MSQAVIASALFVGAIAPAADAWIVARHGVASDTAIHLATVAYLIVADALAAAGR